MNELILILIMNNFQLIRMLFFLGVFVCIRPLILS